MSELKETKKMKVVQLHEQTPKQFSNPTTTPKIAHQGPNKTKMTPKISQNQRSELKEIKSNSNVTFQGIIENESCLTT